MALMTTLVLSALSAGTVNGKPPDIKSGCTCKVNRHPQSAGMSWGWGAAPVATHALADGVPDRNNTLSNAFAQVKATLDSIRNLPHCKQAAIKDLVRSCDSFDSAGPQTPRSTQGELDLYQQQFAIRMSHCELETARQPSPSVCEPIVIDGSTASAPQTTSCVEALYQTNNMWTTYESMKSRGVVLCYAMRAEQDKQEKLELLMFLIEKTSDIGSALETSQYDLERLSETLRDVERSTRTFYDEMNASTQDIQSEMRKSFDAIRKDTSGVAGLVQSLSSSMGQAKQKLENYANRVDGLFNQVQAVGAQMDGEWSKRLAGLQAQSEEVRNLYQHQLELILTSLSQSVYAITKDVDIAASITGDMLNKFSTLDDRLSISSRKAGDLLVQIDDVRDAQLQSFANLQELTNGTMDDLRSVREGSSELRIFADTAIQFTQTFSWLNLKSFMKWYLLIFTFAAVAWWRIGTSATVALLITTFVPALLIASITSSRVPSDMNDAQPSFFCNTPYGSILAAFMVGVSVSTIAFRLRGVRTYDPAAQLDPYTGLDDMDIEEQKQNRIRL
ncbi:hypothetical protein CERZMDRAFT_87412 [Cercospora zeae-maydis SCOH1-5]|uniref:Nuclear fusion protein KAR5 n=1 Tax=Cercospora zeae-maydis SCOH1-5 TaxID=717836 RepID=A0A6A6F7U9_9PEZI|nr:hypothetical protein CERZMDRAFT_87412 [Cercospora zeae-maydis SCOH1-5]